MTAKLLQVENLAVNFQTEDGVVQAVRGIDFSIAAGSVLALVGESGSGKSVTALSLLGLLPNSAKISGQINWLGEDLLTADPNRIQALRGNEISMIFQDPLSALNPAHRVGKQVAEGLLVHQNISKANANKKAVEMLELVGIPSPEKRAKQYPHEFSGGMRQRVMIAMALACDPKLLIADEPTTALDVTVQAQILEVLAGVTKQLGTAIIMITHDLGVVANIADQVAVMYAGSIVESGSTESIFANPLHPYTAGLLGSIPRVDRIDQQLFAISGNPPSMLAPPNGCTFHPRCDWNAATYQCTTLRPELETITAGQKAACHRAKEFISAQSLRRD